MKHLFDLSIDEQFYILSKAQFLAIEENDYKEVERLEIKINNLNISNDEK
jgi:hypothetical protein